MSVQINANKLINARHRRGLSQQQVVDLARTLGRKLSLFTISKAENGGPVNPGTAMTFSEVLNIPMRQLVVELNEEVYSDIPNPKSKTATQKVVKSSRTYPKRRTA